ncbi:Hypothetical_protein [Hexamita inflata]|uniref:Hypothetical_protein n=1 Tax=Hexamita inflata TaxID=28002 RepID=A0AA86PPE4_9EUKA|nr:Hypothetical protein HINF_LOCUS29592 [Hexamita inflata]
MQLVISDDLSALELKAAKSILTMFKYFEQKAVASCTGQMLIQDYQSLRQHICKQSILKQGVFKLSSYLIYLVYCNLKSTQDYVRCALKPHIYLLFNEISSTFDLYLRQRNVVSLGSLLFKYAYETTCLLLKQTCDESELLHFNKVKIQLSQFTEIQFLSVSATQNQQISYQTVSAGNGFSNRSCVRLSNCIIENYNESGELIPKLKSIKHIPRGIKIVKAQTWYEMDTDVIQEELISYQQTHEKQAKVELLDEEVHISQINSQEEKLKLMFKSGNLQPALKCRKFARKNKNISTDKETKVVQQDLQVTALDNSIINEVEQNIETETNLKESKNMHKSELTSSKQTHLEQIQTEINKLLNSFQ